MTEFDFLNPLKGVTLRFTEEQLQDIIDFFDEKAKPLLIINEDAEPTNVITVEQLQSFLELKKFKFHRRSYHYPSYFELMKEVEAAKAGTTRMLTKDVLIYVLNRWIIEPDMMHELKLAFKVFDTEKRGFLELQEVQGIVSNYPKAFEEHEVTEFLRDVNVRGDGNIFYENFVDSMFAVQPEMHTIKKEYLYEDPDEDPSVPPLPEPEPEPELEPPPPPPPPPPPKKKKK